MPAPERIRSLVRGLCQLVGAVLIAAVAGPAVVGAAAPLPPPWHAPESGVLAPAGRGLRPLAPHRVLGLDRALLFDTLAQAPLEDVDVSRRAPVFLDLPRPDGSFQRFRIEESPILEPELAAQFPEIRTWRGQGVDDPTATARLGWTARGFHAIVLSRDGAVYVDPWSSADTRLYRVFHERDLRRDAARLPCRVGSDDVGLRPEEMPATFPQQAAHGAARRTYRLAVAATGEYTAFFGGTVAGAMNGIAATMNRVNGIYERDLAVRMVLVANNASIVYTGTADPYSNGNPTALLCENAANLDTVIGAANYDVGHVFATASGGLAALGVACNGAGGSACGFVGSLKAWGTTGIGSPQGDAFDVDYVAHEIGHQFGGAHTFNGTTGACAGGNRDPGSAYEPGSGSTIMAYAGICGVEDLQDHSDAYFHARSQEQMIAFVNGTGCPVVQSTGNTPPVVNAGPDHTIPRLTPFALTASGSDANGDGLTFAWEQYDLGTASPPNTDNGSRPILRSFVPAASPVRTFPRLADLLNNTATFGESLPTTTRALAFRVTARDNRAGGGGSASDDVVVNVDGLSGPFAVLQPNTAVSWAAGSLQTVTWDVANTGAAPVSCASVRILLSLDGGLSFPLVLDPGTANDGSQVVQLPPTGTAAARLKVEAVGNVFFDVSNASFSLTPTDLIFRDGFEPTGLGPWSASAGDGGDLAVTPAAAMNGTTMGLRAQVNDTAPLYVQDEFPLDEARYRARFYFDPNGFDPGEAQAHLRTRIFIGFEEAPLRRLFAIVLRRQAGAYALMGRARLDDNAQADTGFFTISDGPHVVELDWKRSSAPGAGDGWFELWIDGASVARLSGLDNDRSRVDLARLGALSVKSGAAGAMFWDEFESRRVNAIGP